MSPEQQAVDYLNARPGQAFSTAQIYDALGGEDAPQVARMMRDLYSDNKITRIPKDGGGFLWLSRTRATVEPERPAEPPKKEMSSPPKANKATRGLSLRERIVEYLEHHAPNRYSANEIAEALGADKGNVSALLCHIRAAHHANDVKVDGLNKWAFGPPRNTGLQIEPPKEKAPPVSATKEPAPKPLPEITRHIPANDYEASFPIPGMDDVCMLVVPRTVARDDVDMLQAMVTAWLMRLGGRVA